MRSANSLLLSEGIGRTGVVALLEGALNLIESKCGVYPLDMVTALRDQRPKLIQNYPLFKFACESILYLYSECLTTRHSNGVDSIILDQM